jgi:WD40 repeat protein
MIGDMTDYSPPVNQSDLSAETFSYYQLAKLSGDGQVLVTGMSKIVSSIYDAEMIYITHKWNSTIGSWGVMDDKGGLLSKTRENIFACMAVSDDGTVLAVCSDPGIEVYSWNVDKSSWIPRDVVFACNETCKEYAG